MTNKNIQNLNNIPKITFEEYKTDKIKQIEKLYYIAFGLTTYSKKIIKVNIKTIYNLINEGLEIYELYKKDILCRFQFDIDGIKEINDINKLLICYNDIINDEEINDIYNNILNKTFKIDILCYGEFEKETIMDIIKLIPNFNQHLNVHYEQKKKELSGKSFSTHISLNCYILHEYFTNNLHPYKLSLTNTTKSINIELDNTIYKEFGILRASSSDKTAIDKDKNDGTYKTYKTGIKIADKKEFIRQFLQYPKKLTEVQKQAYIKIADIITNKYINRDNKTDKKTDKKTNKATTKDKQQDKPKEEAKIKDKEEIEICNISTPVPLGMIRDILTNWPNMYYDKWVCVEGNIYWSAFTGFIQNCPYEYNDIEDIINEYWNKMPEDDDKRSNPNFLNNWAKDNINYNNTNQYFFSLLKPFNDYKTFDDYILDKNDEGEFDYDLYINYKNKGPSKLKAEDKRKYNQLTKQYRELKNNYHEIYNTDKNKLIYSHYIRDFNIFHIFTEQYNPSKPSHYDYYKDSITRKIYVKNENIKPSKNITFSPVSQQDFKGLYDEDIKKIINTNKQYFNNMMYKYTYVKDEDIKAAERMLYIRGLGIKEDIDRKRFFDFVRSKLLNEESIYKHNFILWGDKNSLKTSFIDTLSDFIEVHKLEPSKINAQFNTEFKASVILIDELPANMKERTKVIETLKRNTSTTKIEIERKGYDKEIINNKSNIIINTNHKEIGGLFDYQENGEMFKRFYIIETKEIQQDLIKEYVKYLQDPAKVKAFIELLKNLPPLTDEELNNKKTQQQYYNYVKDNTDNRRVLTAEALSLCVRKKDKNYFLKMLYFIKTLKNNDIITSKEKERQLLQDKGLIKYDDKNGIYIIQEIYQFYKFYYSIDEDEDSLKKFLKSEYKYIVKEQQEDNNKEQQQEDNKESEPFEAI